MSPTPEKPPADTGRHWKKSALQVLFAMLIGVALAMAMPYVIGEELGVRGVARIYAPLVGAQRGTEGRDAVSVLLVDDRSLQNAQQTWPASYGYYARLLDALASYRPRAVFIDVVFASRRADPSLERLAESACKARAAGTRVYLAARRNETGSFALRPELQALVPRCIEAVAIEYDPDALDQLAWNYRIRPEQDGQGEPLYSAAAAIYRDLGGELPEHGHAALAVNWGTGRRPTASSGWCRSPGTAATTPMAAAPKPASRPSAPTAANPATPCTKPCRRPCAATATRMSSSRCACSRTPCIRPTWRLRRSTRSAS